MLTALITEAGGAAIPGGISPDTPEGFLAALRAVGDVDCIVTTGGVSVGTFDVVRTVLAEHGALHFWRVRMRPGAPFAFGAFAGKPVLALPGNPVAAFVAFAVFVHPALMRMLGQQPEMYRTTAARLVNTVEVPGGLQLYLRARLSLSHSSDGRIDVDTTIDQAVGNVAALAAVDALVIVPEGVTRIETGTVVDTILLRG
jgi:molybdenum cofactor synthesis domain-containing protein